MPRGTPNCIRRTTAGVRGPRFPRLPPLSAGTVNGVRPKSAGPAAPAPQGRFVSRTSGRAPRRPVPRRPAWARAPVPRGFRCTMRGVLRFCNTAGRALPTRGEPVAAGRVLRSASSSPFFQADPSTTRRRLLAGRHPGFPAVRPRAGAPTQRVPSSRRPHPSAIRAHPSITDPPSTNPPIPNPPIPNPPIESTDPESTEGRRASGEWTRRWIARAGAVLRRRYNLLLWRPPRDRRGV